MDFKFLISLFKGGNVWETTAKLLTFGGGVVAGLDSDKVGNDDLIADVMVSAADGLTAYARKDYNRAGNIIDGLISALETLKARLKDAGKLERKNE